MMLSIKNLCTARKNLNMWIVAYLELSLSQQDKNK
jgi:hypothetical protein